MLNAIYAQTGLVTFSGPHFSSLGMIKGCEYTIENLKKMVIGEGKNEIKPSPEWSDDLWFLDQEKRNFIKNEGWWVIRSGSGWGTNRQIITLRNEPPVDEVTATVLFHTADEDDGVSDGSIHIESCGSNP